MIRLRALLAAALVPVVLVGCSAAATPSPASATPSPPPSVAPSDTSNPSASPTAPTPAPSAPATIDGIACDLGGHDDAYPIVVVDDLMKNGGGASAPPPFGVSLVGDTGFEPVTPRM
jgi:hypothetical protein